MTQRLPLVAAQPGIWMAEKLSTLPSAWSVAHYVELTGELDASLLAKAVVAGLEQADTLRMRFSEDNGEVWQWVDSALAFAQPEIIDLRDKSAPHEAARALMQADLQQDIRADGNKPLVFHLLIQVGEKRWYWYQRYHHLLVDGFSFPAITRQIAAIYRAWLHGESTPDSPLRRSPRWWKSINSTVKAMPGNATVPSGASSESNFRLLLRCQTIRCRDGRPVRILFV